MFVINIKPACVGAPVHCTCQALDLLSKMLVFHPAHRISVEDALAHPWLAALHDESDEPVAEEPFRFDVPGHLRPEAAADMMWQQVLRFHPQLATAGGRAAAKPGLS